MTTTFVIPPQVMSRQVGDETVILDLASGMYFGLDPVGARIWQLIAEGQSLDSVITGVMSEFDVTEERLRQDVNALMDELASRGLVEIRRQ
jgi:hypothetical protein